MGDAVLEKIIVTGSRYSRDRLFTEKVLNAQLSVGPFILVVGYNPEDKKWQGVDQLAYEWSQRTGVLAECHPAHWRTYGKSAGPRRNGDMSRSGAVKCIHFPGGVGTADMVSQAHSKGIECVPAAHNLAKLTMSKPPETVVK